MRIGIDLGGTKIEAIAMDQMGQQVLRKRIATPKDDYARTVSSIVDLVFQFETELGTRCTVGVGIPGAISKATGRIKNANSTCLIGYQLDKDLESRLQRPVRLANDANCFTLSEALDGAAEGADLVFGVILGTGVGGGIVHRGRVVTGINAIAGEWGHNPLPWPTDDERPGPKCYCGKFGCIETFLSVPGLIHDWKIRKGTLAAEYQDGSQRAEDVVSAAENGDQSAEDSLASFEDRLARSLAQVINILDPDVIVLGGGLSGIGRLYPAMRTRLAEYVFSDRVDTKILPPKHGDSSGVRGAARLWPEMHQ
ncbi:MAG: ROK family protein [Kiloniellales bacterium]|nr:ROK family protein [Kiloniellales bacterium]